MLIKLLLAWYLFVSIVTFAIYAVDKRAAKRRGWRVGESRLHFLGLAGGVPGALCAQHLLHHKTRSWRFQLITWTIAAGHAAGWIAWWMLSRS